MKNLDPRSPFNWHLRTEPSIFAKDPAFRPRKDGLSVSQTQTEQLNKRREGGEAVGTFHGIQSKKTQEMLAYKQFGVYSRAQPGKRNNKHEEPK